LEESFFVLNGVSYNYFRNRVFTNSTSSGATASRGATASKSVTEISNYPESKMYELKYDEYCGQKNMYSTKYFKNVSPDKFYIKYSKGQDFWKH